jgi:hypothetical protein
VSEGRKAARRDRQLAEVVMRARFAFALVVVSLLASLGCSPAREAPAGNPSPPPAASLPAAPGAPMERLPTTQASLADRLAAEAAGRPPLRPRAEDVLATLGVSKPSQVLAAPVEARFCLAGFAEHQIAVAVCEYGSEADARRGADRSERVFGPLVPNRTLDVRGPLLVTIVRPGAGPELAAQARALAARL